MKRILSLVLILACLLGLTVPAAGAGTDLQTLVNGSAKYMLSAVKSPEPGDVGGEWAVLGLARSGYPGVAAVIVSLNRRIPVTTI